MSKFHIMPPIIEGPYGGGNQFAQALRNCWRRKGIYAEQLKNSETLIFNGFPFRDPNLFLEAAKWKSRAPAKRRIITRIDGPIAAGRNNPDADKFDRAIYRFSELAADGIVVQSQWSLNQILAHPDAPTCPAKVIGNAANNDIFFPLPKAKNVRKNSKIRIIATSWSNNPLKGYPVYAWLDENLDFSKYSFTVVGKTEYKFKNIDLLEPVDQTLLASILRNHDIYITASKIESCSNAMIEALQCGLPCIAPNYSSHPEYISSCDLLFSRKEDILDIIDQLRDRIDFYRNQINVKSIEQISQSYVDFSRSIPFRNQVSIHELRHYLCEDDFIKSGISSLKQNVAKLGKRIFQGG
jgi:glycosyltransferase involved in cell wall biosynthesis